MTLVVPVEEVPAEGSGVLDRTETLGEIRPIFQCLELGLGKRIIVAGVRSAVRLRDAQVRQQKGDSLGGHC